MGKYNNKRSSLSRSFAATWRTLTHDLFDTYRPERHYMRGPGPKWREKHGQGATESFELPSQPMTTAHA